MALLISAFSLKSRGHERLHGLRLLSPCDATWMRGCLASLHGAHYQLVQLCVVQSLCSWPRAFPVGLRSLLDFSGHGLHLRGWSCLRCSSIACWISSRSRRCLREVRSQVPPTMVVAVVPLMRLWLLAFFEYVGMDFFFFFFESAPGRTAVEGMAMANDGRRRWPGLHGVQQLCRMMLPAGVIIPVPSGGTPGSICTAPHVVGASVDKVS